MFSYNQPNEYDRIIFKPEPVVLQDMNNSELLFPTDLAVCCAFSLVEEEEDIIDLGPDVLESSNTPVYAEIDDDDRSLVKEGLKEGLTEEYRGQDGEERTEVNGDQENEEGIYVNEWLTERTEVEEGSIKMVVGGQEKEGTQEQETSVNQEQEVIYANEQQEGIQEQEGIYANGEQEEIYRNQEQEQIYASQEELEVFVNQELEIYVNQEGILNEDDDEIQQEDEQQNGQYESNEEVEQENGQDESSEEAFVEEEVEFDPKIPTTHPMLLAELNVHVYNGHLNCNAIFSEQYKV